MDRIYLDHAATTPLSQKAFAAMKPYFTDVFGNPNSQHVFGREGAKAVNDARQLLANCIGAKPSEIYFTSCGTEADNWAVKGTALQNIAKGKHIITSVIEHPAIYTTCKQLEKEGVIGKLHNKFYTTVGNGTAVASAKAFADEYAQKLIADGVDAVIMTST